MTARRGCSLQGQDGHVVLGVAGDDPGQQRGIFTAGSPFGDPERAAGRWLPALRLGIALALTAAAAGALAAAGTGTAMAGGTVELLRNLAGLVGLGLIYARGARDPRDGE